MKTAVFAAAAGVILAVAACSTTNHDTQAPATDIVVKWWRLDTPPSVVTEYFACFGTDGLILDQGDGNVSVTPDDKMCPPGGTPYQVVYASGSQPKVLVWAGRTPPDSIPAGILAPYRAHR